MGKYAVENYVESMPCIDQTPYVADFNSGMLFSDVVWSQKLGHEFSLPERPANVITVNKAANCHKTFYRVDGTNWKPIDFVPNSLRIASAGQNAIDLRWLADKHVGAENNFWANNLVVHFSPEKFAKVAMELFDVDGLNIEMPLLMGVDDPMVAQLVTGLSEQAKMDGVVCPMYQESVLQMLCVHLLSRYCTVNRSAPNYKGGLSVRQLSQVLEYIDAHFNQAVSLESLAQLSNMSVYHFARLFKETMGVSPRQYILALRVKHAKRLLRETDTLIEKIALSVGYASPFHFSRMFKQHTGMSPKMYREQVQK